MNFLDYIKGNRKGRDAHRIEKDSMNDPFLFDAIEGFDSVSDNHAEKINDIQKRIKAKSMNKPAERSHFWQVAATVTILIFGLAGYLFIDYQNKSNLQAQDGQRTIIEIYVPEVYYVENVTVVAKKNVELAKAYKPNISQFKVEDDINNNLDEKELEKLNDRKPEAQEAIEIYIPEDFESKSQVISMNKKPEPIIGHESYRLYLKKSLRRPTDDACRGRKGNVFVEFSVDNNGQPYLFEVVQSLCGTSDNEAIRLIQSGPKWTQGTERARVKVEF